MEILRCDRPYNIDEARKKKGLPRRRRKDSRTTAYELTIRVPVEYQSYFNGKKKLTKTVFALNKKDDLKAQVASFEKEKNADLESALAPDGSEPMGAGIACDNETPFGDYAQRYVDVRSNGSVKNSTLVNERRYLKYVKATIGSIAVSKLKSEDVECCLLEIPRLSEKWGLEKMKEREENRKTAYWVKKHGRRVKPLQKPKVAGPDMQAKVLKFIREVLNYALEKEHVTKNVAKAKYLTRIFKKSKPLIDPLMADEAARFLHEVELLPTGFFKLALLLMLDAGLRPEEVQAVRPGNFTFTENESLINITSVVRHSSNAIDDYPKSDASRRSIPIDSYTADVAKKWIAMKSDALREVGLVLTMNTPLISPLATAYSYRSFKNYWDEFIKKAGFEGIRPYALRHTFATLNLANGENVKTISVLMGHASSAYTLDLYAGYVPMTGVGLGERYMNFLRNSERVTS